MSDIARELRREPLACDPAELCRLLNLDQRMVRQPRGVIVCCPAHDDRNPSCSVRIANDDTLAVKCQSCGWSADAIGLIEKVHGVGFVDAIAELARMTGRYDLLENGASREPRPRPPLRIVPPETPALADVRFHEIATWLIENCPLNEAPDVAAYLDSRGILADAQGTGCAALPTADLHPRVVAAMRKAFGDDTDHCGLVRGTGFAHPDNRIILPWKDRAGRIATLQRRRIDAGTEKRYVFCSGRSAREPFGIDGVRDGSEVLVVSEGAFDALARRKLARLDGDDVDVVAIPSASTLMPDVIAELAAGRDLVLSLDNDAAGDAAAVTLAAACSSARRIVRERPQGVKDAGELLQRRLGS